MGVWIDRSIDLGWRWIDVGLSPFIHLYTYIKATDEIGRILSIKWSRSDGWMMLVSLNLSSSAEWGKFGMTLRDPQT